jgi:hypothetical protein
MLKSKMVFSSPQEYYDVYEKFEEGGTIRKWVNMVEQLSTKIVDKDPNSNILQLKEQLPTNWKVELHDGEFYCSGPKDPVVIRIMRTIGASWDMKEERWAMASEQLHEYIGKEAIFKFKGDMLEVLSELFFTIFQADEGLGISDYSPVDLADDFGVDATGRNVNGHQVAVQVKYRSNPEDLISYADIARTFTSAVCQLKMMDVVEHDQTIYLFTTAGGVTSAFDRVMGRKAIVVPRSVIATKIDNNKNFWNSSFDMIYETLDA